MRKFLIILVSVLFLVTSCKTSTVPKDEPVVVEEAQLLKKPEVNLIEESPVEQVPQVDEVASEPVVAAEDEHPTVIEPEIMEEVFPSYERFDSEKPFSMDVQEQFDSIEEIVSENIEESIVEETVSEEIVSTDSVVSSIEIEETSEESIESSLEPSIAEEVVEPVIEDVSKDEMILETVLAEEVNESIDEEAKSVEPEERSIKDIINCIIAFIMKEKLLSFGLLVTLIGIIYLIAALFRTTSEKGSKYIDVPDDPEDELTSYHFAEKTGSLPVVVETDKTSDIDDDDDFLKSLLKDN